MKVHKHKYKNLEGEEIARSYSVTLKKSLVESLNFQEKDLTAEIKDDKIIIREVKNEENK